MDNITREINNIEKIITNFTVCFQIHVGHSIFKLWEEEIDEKKTHIFPAMANMIFP